MAVNSFQKDVSLFDFSIHVVFSVSLFELLLQKGIIAYCVILVCVVKSDHSVVC